MLEERYIIEGAKTHRILEWLTEHPDDSTSNIAAMLGSSRSCANMFMQYLRKRGMVRNTGILTVKTKNGGYKVFTWQAVPGWQAQVVAKGADGHPMPKSCTYLEEVQLPPLESAWPSPAHQLVALRLPVSRTIPGCMSSGRDSDSTGA